MARFYFWTASSWSEKLAVGHSQLLNMASQIIYYYGGSFEPFGELYRTMPNYSMFTNVRDCSLIVLNVRQRLPIF
jgi:hypothetical protein